MQKTSQLAIDIKDLSKTYVSGEVSVPALKDIDIQVKRGESVVILGPSGAGKTTFLNLIGGITTPDKSTEYLKIFGSDIQKYSVKKLSYYRKTRIGFIFQFYNLFPTLSAIDNVIIAIELLKDKKNKEINLYDIAQNYLEKVGLGHRLNHFPSQLSGGEQQRVAIARALARIPLIGKDFILLCDEPTGNLDTDTGNKIIELLGEINEKEGITCLIVTHNPNIAENLASKVIRIKDGMIE
jgi:putative ABC transport system ATP-binding protein